MGLILKIGEIFMNMLKAFLGLFMLVCLSFSIGCGKTAENQREEAIFDNKAEALIGNLKIFAARGNFDLSEPKTYTADNKKYCSLNFGGTENNKITFRLNDDDSVISEEITVADPSDFEAGKMAGMLLSGTLMGIGVEDADLQKFLTDYQNLVAEEIRKQKDASVIIIDQDIKVHNAFKKKDLRVNIKSNEKQAGYLIEIAR